MVAESNLGRFSGDYILKALCLFQEPTLFNETIFGNVCHGLIGSQWEQASEEEKRYLTREACIIANADDFIQSLPEKYDTVVGDGGVLLSGGQKQRIAIARAVVSKPRILLLDEATSAVDSQTESLVQKALEAVRDRSTIVIIAHRLSTVKNADEIVVMSKGKIIEQGTHAELLALNSAYSRFVKAQTLATKPPEANRGRDVGENDGVVCLRPSPGGIDGIINRLKSGGTDSRGESKRHDASTSISHNYTLFECIRRVFYLQKDMWPLLTIAWICCVIAGLVYPIQAIIFGYLVDTFSLTSKTLQTRAQFWALMFIPSHIH